MKQNQSEQNHLKQILPFLLLSAILLGGCTNKSNNTTTDSNESLPEEKNIVETVILQQQDFTREIVSNGKLSAFQRAELYFGVPGFIEEINVKNGQRVKKGAALANLKNEDYRFSLRKAEFAKEKAEIDKLDILMGMGYKKGETNITADHEQIADIRSGYNQAKIQYDEAAEKLKQTYLKAPFAGTVAGIKQRTFEKADLSKPFCTLINSTRFFIRFPLLETEISRVKTGQKVSVTPIAGAKPTIGTITEIDPQIDENGLVWLKAEVKNPGNYMEGMNVKVSIKKAIQGQLIVPKQAVVLRQNREVLFRYTKGTAYWTYINILDENENQYAVRAADGATLELGDTVIVSNNLNLAHESVVEIK
jgi:RND family efflux transporter MFP subunit